MTVHSTRKDSVFYLEESICNCREVLRVLDGAGLPYRRHLELFPRKGTSICVPDDVWLDQIVRNDWILISAHKDKRFEPLQKTKLERLKIRQFSFSCDRLSGSEMADVLELNLAKIEEMCRWMFPPLIASMSTSGVRLRFPAVSRERKRLRSSRRPGSNESDSKR